MIEPPGIRPTEKDREHIEELLATGNIAYSGQEIWKLLTDAGYVVVSRELLQALCENLKVN